MIDQFAAQRIKSYGAKSAFLGYRKYPCHLCISVNEQVVHGLATDRRVDFGDIVSLDVGVSYHGYIGDTARTVPVGGCDLNAQRLLDVTEQALCEASRRRWPETAWPTSAGRCRITLRATGTAWFASSSGMAWAEPCMKIAGAEFCGARQVNGPAPAWHDHRD